ncbi:MAG: fumarylacetoacetate hydrolase family protein [Methanococcaceae archaeon]
MKTITIKNSDEQIPIGKIICVGRNYAEHARELGNEVPDYPILFLKPASVFVASGSILIHPEYSQDLQHEIELVLLIGEEIKDVSLEQAEQAIAGYGAGLDMSLRDLQGELIKKGHPWTLSKCFDTAGLLSEFVMKTDYRLTQQENIWLKVNGQLKQSSLLDKMIFSPAELVKYIASKMTLEAGDLIMTGTPAGVSRVTQGDIIEGGITSLVELKAKVI